jgi:hypothetical protein
MHTGLWRQAQMVGVMLTVVLVLGLVTHPGPTTNVLWNAIIPVLPAVFLLSPALWRNVCPLATLATLAPLRYRTRTIDEPMVRATLVVGVILLFVLVPARRFWFNTDGGALAVAIIMVAILALASGFAFKRKAGFCNAICPVLPVERLYGQRPLVTVPNVRCTPCVGCTERGCIDLSPADSARVAMGPRWASRSWVFSPFGAFAAAFPGFIAGYYTIANGPVENAFAVYRHVLTATAIGLALVVVFVQACRITAATALPKLAALAAALYYWYAAKAVTDAWGITGTSTWGIRVAAFALILAWLIRAR